MVLEGAACAGTWEPASMAAMDSASDHVELVLDALISFLQKYVVTAVRVLFLPWSAAKQVDHEGRDPRMVSGLTAEALHRAARRYFDSRNCARFVLLPEAAK